MSEHAAFAFAVLRVVAHTRARERRPTSTRATSDAKFLRRESRAPRTHARPGRLDATRTTQTRIANDEDDDDDGKRLAGRRDARDDDVDDVDATRDGE
jgi:hypothetical protein